jgi:thioredoxin-like negative regulator of GroEL
MAVMHPYVVIATYKCDKTRPTLPKSLGITSFPTFLLYRDGERIGMLKGANSAGELMQIVANHDKQAAVNESAL